MKIEWQSPDSDQKHEIPEHAQIIFTLKNGSKVGFRIKSLSDEAEYLERENIKGETRIANRRVGKPDRRKK